MNAADYAVAPTGDQLASFNALEARYAGMAPVALVTGDSRANQETAGWLPGGGQPVDIDLGINGDTIENFDWCLVSSGLDLSQVHDAFVEIGVNSARFVSGETEQGMVKAAMAGLKLLSGEIAAGGHVYFNECYDELNNAYDANPLIDAFNADVAAKAAASGGWLVFIPLNYELTPADYRPGDPTHLGPTGEAKVIAADQAAMFAGAHHEPTQIIGLDPLVI